jgi:hypothetical protein
MWRMGRQRAAVLWLSAGSGVAGIIVGCASASSSSNVRVVDAAGPSPLGLSTAAIVVIVVVPIVLIVGCALLYIVLTRSELRKQGSQAQSGRFTDSLKERHPDPLRCRGFRTWAHARLCAIQAMAIDALYSLLRARVIYGKPTDRNDDLMRWQVALCRPP